jgi:hypothetical protein
MSDPGLLRNHQLDEQDDLRYSQMEEEEIDTTDEINKEGKEEQRNFVSIYWSTVFAVIGAVVIFANRSTKEQCFGIQESYIHLIVLASPQALLLSWFILVGVIVLRLRNARPTAKNYTRSRTVTWSDNVGKLKQIVADLRNKAQQPGNLAKSILMFIYFLFAAVAFVSYMLDVIVVGICLSESSNHTLAINHSRLGIDGIMGRSISSMALIWSSFIFFILVICLKQFQNPNKIRTFTLGLLLVVHILMWINSFIQEASEVDNVFHWLENCTNLHPQGKCESERNYVKMFKPWLYSSVVEYCLITVSLTLRVWQSDHTSNFSVTDLEKEERSDKRKWHDYAKIGMWWGIFIGLPVFAGYMIVSSLVVHWQSPPHQDKYSLNRAVIAFLSLGIGTDILLIVCFAVMFWAIRGTDKRSSSLEIEDYLTVTTGFSVQIIAVLIAVSDMFSLVERPFHAYSVLSLIKAVLDLLQGTLQTLMFASLKTISVKGIPKEGRKRQLFIIAVSIIAAINLILFLWSTVFEGHISSSIYPNQVDVFGKSKWRAILVPLYPLAIFYRFHCFWSFLRFVEMMKLTTSRKFRHWVDKLKMQPSPD